MGPEDTAQFPVSGAMGHDKLATPCQEGTLRGNMIVSLQIKLLGADNKRTNCYSSSVNQKICIIAIKNNSNITVNNNFNNDLSFHN
jgi:hypothetical protein